MTAAAPLTTPPPDLLFDHFKRYKTDGADFDLIPLHRFDYVDSFGRPRGKSPFDARWRVEKYESAALSQHARDGRNLGVRLRETDLVIDYDPRNVPPERRESILAELELEYGLDLDACPCVETGGGGLHYYLRKPPGRIRNQLPDFPGIEFKSVGRQVVAAGSKHPNGRHYKWRDGSPPLKDAPEAPAALLKAIARPEPPQRSAGDGGELPIADVKHCLAQLPVEEYRGKHDAWLEVLMSCHAATGGSAEGCEEFVKWSTSDPAYADEGDDHRHRWATFDADGGVGVGTLFHHVIEHDGRLPRPSAAEQFAGVECPIERPEPQWQTDQRGNVLKNLHNAIEAVRALGIQPARDGLRRCDVLRGDLSILRRYAPGIEPIVSDETIAALRLAALREWVLDLSKDRAWDAVEMEGARHYFDPLRDMLEGFEAWDGVQRIDRFLTDAMGAPDRPYERAVSRLLFLGAVARAYCPGVKLDTMTVLEGAQGIGKSSALKMLAGPFFREAPSSRDPNDADTIAALQGFWIVEFSELVGRHADVESFKSFLSRDTDRARFAYARKAGEYPRRCIFVGTTNKRHYLKDSTGNRRFLPIAVERVDFAMIEAQREHLWAEAREEWKRDPQPGALVLPEALWAEAREEQEARRPEDPRAEAVEAWMSRFEGPVAPGAAILTGALSVMPRHVGERDWAVVRETMERLGWRYGRHRPTPGAERALGYWRPGWLDKPAEEREREWAEWRRALDLRPE